MGATLAFATAVATIVNDDPDKTVLIFDSQPGDWIGGGERFTLTPIDGAIAATRSADNTVAVSFNGSSWWYLRFAASDDGVLVPGVYENAMRWPFQDRVGPASTSPGTGRGATP